MPRLRNSLSKSALRFTTVILVCDALADPSDMFFHLKVPLFVGVFLIWLLRQASTGHCIGLERRTTLTVTQWMTVLTVSLVVPLLWTLLGMMSHDIHWGGAPFGLLKTCLFFAILPVLLTEDIDLMPIIIKSSVLVALIAIAMAIMGAISFELFFPFFALLMNHKNAIIIGQRNFSGIVLGEFYYASCPILIFPFTYYCWNTFEYRSKRIRSALLYLLYAVAILASGARADILIALAITGIVGFRRTRALWGWLPSLLVAAVLVIGMAATIVPKFTNTKETSNSVKLRHLGSYADLFESKPHILIYGSGANSEFFTKGFMRWTVDTELTYLEFIRMFGLPMATVLDLALAWLAFRLFRIGDLSIGLAYVGFLVVASTNPLILNSTGLMVIASLYARAYGRRAVPTLGATRFRLLGRGSMSSGDSSVTGS